MISGYWTKQDCEPDYTLDGEAFYCVYCMADHVFDWVDGYDDIQELMGDLDAGSSQIARTNHSYLAYDRNSLSDAVDLRFGDQARDFLQEVPEAQRYFIQCDLCSRELICFERIEVENEGP